MGSADKEMPTLRTARLVLRPYTLADAAELQRLAGEWAVADTTANMPHPYPDGVAETYIAGHQAEFEGGRGLSLAITLREDGRLIGGINFCDLNRRHQWTELGYWITTSRWGQGYCTEAAREMVRYAFEELGLNSVVAWHMTRNPASGRVMQKIGMKYQGGLRQHVQRWGKFEDVAVYDILRSEFKS